MSLSMLRVSGALLLILATAAGTASADTVTVGCSGALGGSYNYSSVQAALNALYATRNEAHTVEIWGTCAESVQVDGFEELTLQGRKGAKIVSPADADANILRVTNSTSIRILQLGIQGPNGGSSANAVQVNASRVDFGGCTIEGASGHGLRVVDLSSVTVRGTVVKYNSRHGISVGSGSVVWVLANSTVQGNWVGVWAEENSQVDIGDETLVAENSDMGVRVFAARAILRGSVKIAGNRVGIGITDGGSGVALGSVQILDNTDYGVFLSAASSMRFNSGAMTVQGNGTAGCQAPSCGGLVAYIGSHIDLYYTTVSENHGAGVMLANGSSARVFSDTVSGNYGNGLHLSGLSTALVSGTSMAGNSPFDFYCTPNAYASGSAQGIGKMACPAFDQQAAHRADH